MKRITKSVSALFMVLVVCSLSIINAFAANDPVQNVSYSYSETGNCTVDYGGIVYVSNSYNCTHRFTVNGRIATCSWSLNSTPSKGTYNNVTKYYLAKSAMRAKAFYWLYLDNDAAIPSSNAKYDQSSTSYWDDISSALDDCGSTGAYAFVHCVIDYLQQGQLNPYNDDAWNRTVKAFADKTEYYPNVPEDYEIFYFYPEGNASQSLMSWEAAARGYIKVIKSSSNTSLTDGNSNYSFEGIQYYVSKSATDFDVNGSNYLGYIELNANGEGHSKDGSRATLRFLPPGTYYVKEGYIPSGCSYERNNTVYTVNVTKNHTTTAPLVLRVSDNPKTCYGKIVKTSTKPEQTDGKPEYSFEGIRYSFSKSATDFSPNSNSFLGDVTLNANGEGYTADGSRAALRDLPPGTYFVKETYVPDGCKYKLDSTVYRMTFTFNNDTNHLAVLNVKDEPEGSSGVKVIKKSSVPTLTDGNLLYSLSSAEFTVYKSRTDAEQKANPFMTLTTDENGVSTVIEIDLGTYYVRETKAPTGFELSNEIKELVIDAIREEPYVVEFEDKPVAAPLSILLQKRNATTGADTQADVSGAEYTVSYYTDFLDEEMIGALAPARTWVFSVDGNGMCRYDAEHLVSGDALYTDGSGNNVLPLGTVKIKETKAPDGFYLDEMVFIRQITAETAADVTRYNVPVSDEYEITDLTFSGEKKWDDDNDRDGKRPKSVTIELYRDGELIDTAVVSKETGWKYEFTNLPKAYVDMSLEEHVHNYTYEIKEGDVEFYSSKSTGVLTHPEDETHLICDFTNHYKPAKISVDGTKSWDDYNNRLGLRPKTIKVILNRDGKKLSEVTTSEAQNWSYSFKNLYKYHDGGNEYVYTVTEESVPGYTLTVDGYNMKNTLKSGSVTLNKKDGRNKPMEGVVFKLFTEDGKPVQSSANGTKYKYSGLSDKEDDAEYTTNADGQIIVENLPCGKYYFTEVQSADGFMPYGDKLEFEIDGETDASLSVKLDVKNEKAVMPETGGFGNGLFSLLSAALAAFGAAFLYTTIKLSKKKG